MNNLLARLEGLKRPEREGGVYHGANVTQHNEAIDQCITEVKGALNSPEVEEVIALAICRVVLDEEPLETCKKACGGCKRYAKAVLSALRGGE